MTRFLVLTLSITVAACAAVTAPNRTSVWGHVQLVPHADLPAGQGAGNAYGDRRLRGAHLVDYARPGFTVVYLAGPVPDSATKVSSDARLSIRGGGIRARLEPARMATRVGSAVRVRNLDRVAHIISCPGASLLQQVAPGEEVRVEFVTPGDYRFYLADVSGVDSIVFAAPGVFAVTSDSGRFRLNDLPPGEWTLHAWHPRFPPASRKVVLAAGDSLQVDFEIGVGRSQESER